MRTRVILIAATWAAVVGFVAGGAHAQTPTPPGGQIVLVGVVLLEGGRGLAFVQDPNFTNNKIVTVRLGGSVGPYRVTKILTHRVELTGPGGTVSIPLAGLPGAVSVASRAGTAERPAGEMPPQTALSNSRSEPGQEWPASLFRYTGPAPLVGGLAPPVRPRVASAQDVPVSAARRAPGAPPVSVDVPVRGKSEEFPIHSLFGGKK